MSITVACVPEHFSQPLFELSQDSTAFSKEGLVLKLITSPGGTGQMIEFLETDKSDIAVALTEGIVLRAINDLLHNTEDPIQILGSYVESPLIWSIAIHPNATYKSINDLKNARIGISRFGSGSHIMAFVMGLQNNWPKHNYTFVEMRDIKGLLNGMENNEIDCFLWERVTTKPYYDQKLLKMLDIVIAPWPAFCLATKKSLSISKASKFNIGVKQAIDTFVKDFQTTGIAKIMENKQLHYPTATDIQDWFSNVKFSSNTSIHLRKSLQNCIANLKDANLLNLEQLAKYEAKNGDICKLICHESVQLE